MLLFLRNLLSGTTDFQCGRSKYVKTIWDKSEKYTVHNVKLYTISDTKEYI